MSAAPGPDGDEPFTFPCRFPIKVMGRQEAGFEALVLGLIAEHVGTVGPDSVRRQASSNARYVSVTVTITAESRAQLDSVYRSLTACAQVLLVL